MILLNYSTVGGYCGQFFSKNRLIECLRCCQYVGIIKISGTGIKHTPAENGFHFLDHYSFNIISPEFNGTDLLQYTADCIQGEDQVL